MKSGSIMVIANKWWEADPVTSILLHDKARPPEIRDVRVGRYPTQRKRPDPNAPRPDNPDLLPRLLFSCEGREVELWCLEELMNPAENSSSTLEKDRVLARVFGGRSVPACVIALGTAGMPAEDNVNGCVVVGTKVFIHDPFAMDPNRSDKWTPPKSDEIIESPAGAKLLQALRDDVRFPAEGRFLRPPVNAADPMRVFIGNGFVSVGVVNITNYDDYIWADRAAVNAFQSNSAKEHIGSMETTHGIIRVQSDAPFLYVSGITDKLGEFDFEVTPRVYAQNMVGAHNVGIFLAWILPELAKGL